MNCFIKHNLRASCNDGEPIQMVVSPDRHAETSFFCSVSDIDPYSPRSFQGIIGVEFPR